MSSLVVRVVAGFASVLANRISRHPLFERLGHFVGRISGKYYWEDYVRVYPDPQGPGAVRNFLNHRKFYAFAAQFARGANVVDIGCGTGYGCALLKEAGALSVCGADASKHAIGFAQERFGDRAVFSIQGMTDMRAYADGQFDVAICSEVLEHIKEYGKENEALAEMKRITRPGGLILIGTPNSEIAGDHGFYFGEIKDLMQAHFTEFCIFENALLLSGTVNDLWEQRSAAGEVGVVVTQAIRMDETVLLDLREPSVKRGLPAGTFRFAHLEIDTTLLHNTHSWVIVALRQR